MNTASNPPVDATAGTSAAAGAAQLSGQAAAQPTPAAPPWSADTHLPTALLLNVGCHSDAHEQAKWFGDDIELKSTKYDHELRSVRAAVSGPSSVTVSVSTDVTRSGLANRPTS